jgi:hypothetical protein
MSVELKQQVVVCLDIIEVADLPINSHKGPTTGARNISDSGLCQNQGWVIRQIETVRALGDGARKSQPIVRVT